MAVLAPSSADVRTFEQLINQRSTQHSRSDPAKLRSAFDDAVTMYGQQKHWTGETLIEHVLHVLEMYLAFEPDDEGIIACLLHHTLDTKLWTLDDLEKKYGPAVRSIVSGVHLLARVSMKNTRMSQENLRLMFLRVSDDIRVVLLILCDHSYKLSQLDSLTPEARRGICRDALQLYAPVAARLGIYSLKHHMESNAFPVMYPVDSARINEQIQQLQGRTGDFLPNAAEQLTKVLQQSGISARVEGRQKQMYSIFQKMRLKSITDVQEVYDLFALRVIVADEATCYQTLGVLHRIGHPVANRFKDYIGFPKPNGYQSLHTTLARLPGVPEGVLVEVQIRTEEMHREADLGIAAHWSYKEGGEHHAQRKAKLQQALMPHESSNESEGKNGILTDHIFVLTPLGDIIELPEGSTPLDFAFSVHTSLGLSFKAARVNGSIVPITYELENGDIVEIIKHKDPNPSANWLNILRTPSAKSRLKRYLASQDRPSYVMLGREALNNELERIGLPPLDPDLMILRSFDGEHRTFGEREDLLMKLGLGAQNASSLLPHLDALRAHLETPHRKQRIIPKSIPVNARVEGSIPMPIRYARCCKPDETERCDLTGVIARDGMVRVHCTSCKLIKNANPERRIGVKWEEAMKAKGKAVRK
jgi:GTP diphosphokinase / guanosine-3',5'-bis(diphosphate) 3'-diphosphatase